MLGKFDYDVLVATCECFNRLLEFCYIRVEDLCCLVLDEAHEAKGKSAYMNLIRTICHENIEEIHRPLVVGMTASPLDSVEKNVDADLIRRKIIEIASDLKCTPCYPSQFDPYENGVSHTKDSVIITKGGEEEEKFRYELDQYMAKVVDFVKDRLGTVAPKFKQLDQLLICSDTKTLDTNKFRGTLRDIEKELEKARDSDHLSTEMKQDQSGNASNPSFDKLQYIYYG